MTEQRTHFFIDLEDSSGRSSTALGLDTAGATEFRIKAVKYM